ncbi:hypothetical protein [Cyanobacterium sp. Dongsha4]|nr:hypothetical protein [Cyanobacterium sp. Dongsha4]
MFSTLSKQLFLNPAIRMIFHDFTSSPCRSKTAIAHLILQS